jgi:hypothetical protein
MHPDHVDPDLTNAVLHGGGRVVLRLHARDRHVTLSVAGGSAAVPRRADVPDQQGGWGMAVVDALADRWCMPDHPGGKLVRRRCGRWSAVAHGRSPAAARTLRSRGRPEERALREATPAAGRGSASGCTRVGKDAR